MGIKCLVVICGPSVCPVKGCNAVDIFSFQRTEWYRVYPDCSHLESMSFTLQAAVIEGPASVKFKIAY